MNGILNLNKPSGCTSHDMVSFARRLLGERKIGHTGTLDPIASGVLPLVAGSATKLCDMLSSRNKRYRAVLTLGVATDTMDTTGNIISRSEKIPGESEVSDAVKSFTGEILQTPPVYSAIKVNGKKLYEYARKGIEIIPEPRRVCVYSIETRKISHDEYELDIHCSKGTYIRSLCNDIGEKLKCGGVMSALTRTASGSFDIHDSFTPQELEKMKAESGTDFWRTVLIPPEDILKKIVEKYIFFDEQCSKQAKNGAAVSLTKISGCEFCFDIGDKVMMYDDSQVFFAAGKIIEYNHEPACKAEIYL